MRFSFLLLSTIAPSVAERLAFRLFMTPKRYASATWESLFLQSAKFSTIKIPTVYRRKNEVRDWHELIRVYQWGEGPIVLLLHGWEGRGSQLGQFIKPLVKAGYKVITFDGPAHGYSTGRQCDIAMFASIIKKISAAPLHAIIAHSFGAACALFAICNMQIPISKLILIGCPYNPIWVSDNFAQKLWIPSFIIKRMRNRIMQKYQNRWSWEDFSMERLIKDLTVPVLLVHDKNDREVPYDHAEILKKAGYQIKLLTTSGLGHRRILRSLEVISKIVEFVDTQAVTSNHMIEESNA